MTVEEIEKAVKSYKYRFVSEEELQDALEMCFNRAQLPFVREAILSPRDRVDFLFEDIGLEVKIGGGLSEVTRQLHRYAQLDSIKSIILVTSKMQLAKLPNSINDKPIRIITLMNSVF